MKLDLDFRLLDVSLELHALEDHYALIEKQISNLNHIENETLNEYRKKENLTPEDPEWDFARQEFEHKVDFLLPRFFWGSFIVSLYAVFETSVIEIARLIQKKTNQMKDINDNRDHFTKRAKKYYNDVLDFKLCNDHKIWEHIENLADVRHAIAHANGRLDMLKDNAKIKIKRLEKQNIGITFYYNYLLIDSLFAQETLSAVSSILKDLVERYKKWDTNQK